MAGARLADQFLPLLFFLYLFTSTPTAAEQQEGDIRLAGSVIVSKGRVEVHHNGVWGTVCDDDWDMTDANVVCRQLGYSGAISAPRTATFGEGSGPIHYDNVACTGNEARLADCSHLGIGRHNCGHSEDAGVVCEGELLPKIVPTTTATLAILNSSFTENLTAILIETSTEADTLAMNICNATASIEQITVTTQVPTTVLVTVNVTIAESLSATLTEAATITSTEVSTETVTETSTENVTETFTETSTVITMKTSTDISTETVTEISTERSTETLTETATKTSTEISTEVSIETVTEISTDRSTETLTETVTKTSSELSTETVTETSTEVLIETAVRTSTEIFIETEVLQHNATVTVTHTESNVISHPCADPPLTNTSARAQSILQTGSTSFGVGAIIAVVLGVILLVQLIACTVAWVVCLKRKRGRLGEEERDGASCVQLQLNGVITADEDSEALFACTSTDVDCSRPRICDMQENGHEAMGNAVEKVMTGHSSLSQSCCPGSTSEGRKAPLPGAAGEVQL